MDIPILDVAYEWSNDTCDMKHAMALASVMFSGFILVDVSSFHPFELLSNISLHQLPYFTPLSSSRHCHIYTISRPPPRPDACYLSFSSIVPLSSKTPFPYPSWQHSYLHSFIKTLLLFTDPHLLKIQRLRHSQVLNPNWWYICCKTPTPKGQGKCMKRE